MAAYGSLNRAAQKAHYNALACAKTTVIIHPNLPASSLGRSPRSQPGATTAYPRAANPDAACQDTGLGKSTMTNPVMLEPNPPSPETSACLRSLKGHRGL